MVVVDKFSGKSRGFGFVTFDEKKAMEDAIDAMNGIYIDTMNGIYLDGRSITVDKAQPQGSFGRDRDGDRGYNRGGRDRDRGHDYGGERRGGGGGGSFKCGKPGHFSMEVVEVVGLIVVGTRIRTDMAVDKVETGETVVDLEAIGMAVTVTSLDLMNLPVVEGEVTVDKW